MMQEGMPTLFDRYRRFVAHAQISCIRLWCHA